MGDRHRVLSHPRYRPPTPMFDKTSFLSKIVQFYKETPFKVKNKIPKKNEITFNFTKEIRLKMNRTKKKGSPKN